MLLPAAIAMGVPGCTVGGCWGFLFFWIFVTLMALVCLHGLHVCPRRPIFFSEGGEVMKRHTVGSLTIPRTGIKRVYIWKYYK